MEFMNTQRLFRLNIKAFRPHKVRARAKAGKKPETKTMLLPNADATHALYKNLVRLGWIDGLSRSLSWRHWQRRGENERSKSAQAT